MKYVCPTCKTKKFRKSTDSGLVCKYGHKLLGVQQEQAEDEGFAGGRRRKTVARNIDNMDTSNPLQQRSNFVLVIQYALQVLSRSMVQELNFPPELEPTVRELWLLYLSDSKTEILEAYQYDAYETEVLDKANGSEQQKLDIYEKIKQEELTLDDLSDDESTSDDSEEDVGKIKIPRAGTSRLKWGKFNYSKILVMIYLACIYLNYPILPNDIVRFCQSGQIPYLKMQERIPEDMLSSFSLLLSNSMNHIPTPTQLGKDAYQFSKRFTVNCKLEFPNLNIPLYLGRFCAQFFLPVEGYFYAKYIFTSYRKAHYVDLCIANRNGRLIPATTILMACVVAAVKIIYCVGDFKDDTLSKTSEFDSTVTKKTWANLINENIARWKKINEEQDDLENIIRFIQNTTIASSLVAAPRDKQLVLLSALDQIEGDQNKKLQDKAIQAEMMMDTYDMMKAIQANATSAETLQQGYFYYSRMSSIAPPDYLNVIELASLVLGETANSMLEVAVQKIDIHLRRSNYTTNVREKDYNERFGIKEVVSQR